MADEEQSVEDRAAAMGWRPKEDWKGDTSGWIDAETFVERGEKIMPVLKSNMGRLEETNASLARELADLKVKYEGFKGFQDNFKAQALEQARAELREAAADGDVERFDKVQKQIDATQAQEPNTEATDAWAKRNPWYETDVEMTVYANQADQVIGKRRLSVEEHLAALDQEMQSKFPDKFGNPQRDAAPAVEGGVNVVKRTAGGKKGYDDLPPEAKQMCDAFIKDGLIKDRKEYVDSYDFEG